MTHTDIRRLNLDRFHWKNRVLLLFSPSESAELYRWQLEQFAGEDEGLVDRDLVRLHLFAEGESFIIEHPHGQILEVEAEVAESARGGYGVEADEFTVILVGKDGALKGRWTQPVPASELFDLIDSMPMRQEEMQQDDG